VASQSRDLPFKRIDYFTAYNRKKTRLHAPEIGPTGMPGSLGIDRTDAAAFKHLRAG
jgi:hypothetical protein